MFTKSARFIVKAIYNIHFLSILISVMLISSTSYTTLIIINGTSSAGKSTLAQALSDITGFTIMKTDDIFTESWQYEKLKHILQEYTVNNKLLDCSFTLADLQKAITLLTQEEQALILRRFDCSIQEAKENFYKDIIRLHAAGSNIILDAINTPKDAFKGNNILHILVYCSLHNLLKHVKARNALNIEIEKRSTVQAFMQFLDLYIPRENPDDSNYLDSMTESDMNAHITKAVKRVSHEGGGDLCSDMLKIKELPLLFKTAFNPENNKKIFLKQRFSYDLIINSGLETQKTAAQRIKQLLSYIN